VSNNTVLVVLLDCAQLGFENVVKVVADIEDPFLLVFPRVGCVNYFVSTISSLIVSNSTPRVKRVDSMLNC
jgi:hypothetical protein